MVPVNLVVFWCFAKARGRWEEVPAKPDLTNATFGVKVKTQLRRVFKGTWPWWFAVIGYVISLLVVAFSAFLVLLYCLSFTEEKIKGWVLSSFFAVGEDVLLNEPIAIAFGVFLGSFGETFISKIIEEITDYFHL